MVRLRIKALLLLFSILPAAPVGAELVWEQLPPLPDAIGFGGPAAGVHNNALIVAGGANFPEAPPWEGGQKVWHDRIFVLEKDADNAPTKEWIDAGTLPKRIAYGLSVSTPDGLLIIGGEEDGTAIADVYRLRWNPAKRQIEIESLPPLPQAASYICGGRIGQVVYVIAAARSEGADRLDQKFFWALDLEKLRADSATQWTELPACPGEPRHKAIAAVQALGSNQQNLFVIGGSNPRYLPDGSPDLANFENYSDAYRFDPKENSWTRVADLPVIEDPRDLPNEQKFAGEKWTVTAGTGIGVGQSQVLVFSGATGRYLTLPVDERPEFPGTVLAYHTITDTWAEAGQMPTGVVTTSITTWGETGPQQRIVIPSGEVKPGVRTNQVQSLRIENFTAEFGSVNYGILITYLVGMLAVGGFFAFRTQSTDDFFRGGQRVPFWVAGLSIFATMLSSITFVALPAKVYATDWLYYVAQLTIIPIAMIVVWMAIPFFRYIDATSAYEYLEKRFSRLVRLIASAQFVAFQIGRMAIVMYLPALALATITPLSVMQCVLAMGVLSVIYCTLGGVEAVVWTDALQTIVLMGGLLVAIVVVLANVEGGASTVMQTALDDGKLHWANFDFSLNSYTTTAIWVIVVGQMFQSLYSYTSDQAVVQRYLTTKNQRDARRAMWTTAWMGVFGSLLFFVMGTALYVYYKTHPQLLDVGMKNDAIFPLFIATELPIGVAGLVVAGVFAAAQSTISTSMNSTATAIVTDFCMPLGICKTDTGYLWLARFFTAMLGVAGTAIACWLVILDETSMIDTFIKVIGLFGGAVCGLFMLGILTRRATAIGSLVGSLCGFIAVLYAMLHTNINFFLYAAIGTVTTFVVGYLVSSFTPAPQEPQLAGLTIYNRVTSDSD